MTPARAALAHRPTCPRQAPPAWRHGPGAARRAARCALGRRGFLLGAAGAAVLSACGDGSDGGAERARTRTVEGVDGPIEVPVDPQRVVAVYGDADLDALCALGVSPIAVGNFAAQDAATAADLVVVPWLAAEPEVEDAAMVRVLPEVDEEGLVALRPDLLVFAGPLADAPQIGVPVVALDSEQPGLEGTLEVVARAFGKEAEADRLVAELDARIEDLRGRIDTSRTVSIAYAYDVETIGVYNPLPADMLAAPQIAQRLGLRRPDAQEAFTDDLFTVLSLEQVQLLDADVVLLVYGDDEQAGTAMAALDEVPVWRSLPAVARGDVVPVTIHWERRGCLLAAHAVLDDIERLFAL